MIEIVEKGGALHYTSKDVGELDALAGYLDEIFPDAEVKRARWDKEMKRNLMEVDMGDDATEKDFADLLKIYEAAR